MPSLSVCLFVDTDLAAVARSLGPLRPVADEIVVAVDDRYEGDLDPLRAIADLVELRPFVWPLEANLEALYAMCSGDWLLRLDGDEVPSAELVDELSGWEWADGVTHALVPCMWIDPTGTGWLRSNPWWPDPLVRLLRRGVDLGTGPRQAHWSPSVPGGARILNGPIYHLAHLGSSLADREAKARRYHRAVPSARTHGGASMSLYYLPERAIAAPQVAPIPEADRSILESVAGIDLPLTPPEVDHESVAPARSSDSFGGVVAVEHIDPVVLVGAEAEVLVMVTSVGTMTLTSRGPDVVNVGAQWSRPGSDLVEFESRAELLLPIDPGRSESVRVRLPVPTAEGEWSISIGLVHEGVRWLARAEPVTVVSRRRPKVQVAGGISPHAHLGDDLIVSMLVESLMVAVPEAEVVLVGDAPDEQGARFGLEIVPSGGPVVHRGPGGGSRSEVATRAREALEAVDRHVETGAPLAPELDVLVRCLQAADVFVLATAGSLTSTYSVAGVWPRVLEAGIADRLGIPVVVTGAGIGALSGVDREAVADMIERARHVDVRDPASAAWATRARKAEVRAGPDIAGLAMDGTESERSRTIRRLVVSLRGRDSDRLVRRVALLARAYMDATGAEIVVLPQEVPPGRSDAAMADELTRHGVTVAAVAEIEDAPRVIGAADAAIGSRFHLGVLAAAAGVPSVLLPTDSYDRRRARGLVEMSGGSVAIGSSSRTRRSLVQHLLSEAWAPTRPVFPLPVVTEVIEPLLRVRGL